MPAAGPSRAAPARPVKSATSIISACPTPRANTPPVVNAGIDVTIALPAALLINGTVVDDGLPAPPALAIHWTKISGPGTVTFTPANAASTIVTFSSAGTYVLRLSANDGLLSASDEIQITCITPTNTAPVVNAGIDVTLSRYNALLINGTVTDDGLPYPPTLTIAWTKISGPGTVNFSSTTTASTTVSFSAAGVYVLRLSASDGTLGRTRVPRGLSRRGRADAVAVVNENSRRPGRRGS
jgi:hypothetical protein